MGGRRCGRLMDTGCCVSQNVRACQSSGSLSLGKKLVPGASGEAMTADALTGLREGMMAFSERSLHFWHGAGHF